MDFNLLLNIALLAIAMCSAATLLYRYVVTHKGSKLVENLADIKQGEKFGSDYLKRQQSEPGKEDAYKDVVEENRASEWHRKKQSPLAYWQEMFFRAGWFRRSDRLRFRIFRKCSLFLFPVLFFYGFSSLGTVLAVCATVLGFLLGWQLPLTILSRQVQRRDYEILYYLPLEVEQLVIGVSSSLDIGPCIQGVVSMADERNCHNPVTELFRYVQQYVKTGASLDEALIEVGRLSCHPELKHTFMALAQVSRHGGEITRQLQQLADSVSQQREVKVDAKIRKLELEATGPVGLVFLAFMGLLLVGLGTQVSLIFQG